MFCGSSLFFVSGMKNDKIPATMQGSPSTSIGKGVQYRDKFAIKGHNRPKSLANVELKPTAWLLRFVGNISAVIVQTRVNAHPEAHLPIKKKISIAVEC